jgi:hypothetical protein
MGYGPFPAALLPDKPFLFSMIQICPVYQIMDNRESENRNLFFLLFVHLNPPF